MSVLHWGSAFGSSIITKHKKPRLFLPKISSKSKLNHTKVLCLYTKKGLYLDLITEALFPDEY